MSNNVGMTVVKLPRTIGETITVTNGDVFDRISGEVDIGFIAYDDDGTMGVCTKFDRDEAGNPTYELKTVSKDTEIDIQTILNKRY